MRYSPLATTAALLSVLAAVIEEANIITAATTQSASEMTWLDSDFLGFVGTSLDSPARIVIIGSTGPGSGVNTAL